MSRSDEIEYADLKRSMNNPDLRFLDPILRLAGDTYLIRAITTTETGHPREVCATLSQEQFDELKGIRRTPNNYTQLNKPEEA